MADQWLTTEQAAHRLGVKPETLYAYVSRGLLRSHPAPGARRASRFERDEVERVARGRRSGGRASGFELLVDTGLTLLDPAGKLYYRGWDATAACRAASYERVAEWLWTGLPAPEPPRWEAAGERVGAARLATSGLPPGATPVDRMRVAAAVLATTDPLRHDRRPEAVARAGRSLVAALVDSLPPDPRPPGAAGDAAVPLLELPEGGTRAGSVAARLWSRLSRRPPAPGELAVFNAALVLLADHELAASTLAARVAASTWADPYLVVQTGLGVLGGPLHGAHAEEVRSLLEEVMASGSAEEAIGARLRSGDRIPGFGHAVYRAADPRAVALLGLLEDAGAERSVWRAVQGVLAVMRDRNLPAANIDLASAAMCLAFGLGPGAGEAVFAVARCAGWLAHAAEEYPHRLRFRPRALYTGPPPGDPPPG